MNKQELINKINEISEFRGFQYNVNTYDKSNGQPLHGIYALVKKHEQSSTASCFGKTEIEALEWALKYLKEEIRRSEYARNFIKSYCSKCTHNSEPYKNYRICDILDTCFATTDGEPTEFEIRMK